MTLKNWTLNTVTADTKTNLISPSAASTADIVVIGREISNHGTAANISMSITNVASADQARLISSYPLAANTSLHVDSRIVIDDNQKLMVESDSLSVSFSAHGDET